MKDSETIQRLYQKQRNLIRNPNQEQNRGGFWQGSINEPQTKGGAKGRVPNALKVDVYFKEIVSRDLVLQSSIETAMEIMPPKKIVLSTSSKKMIQDKKQLLVGLSALKLISSQKSQTTGARKSIAAFKLREGGVLGCKVTLRGKALHLFLDKLLFLALPRARPSLIHQSIDADCNFNIGIADPLIFIELEGHYDIFQSLRGIGITLVTSINKKNVLELLLSGLQMKPW